MKAGAMDRRGTDGLLAVTLARIVALGGIVFMAILGIVFSSSAESAFKPNGEEEIVRDRSNFIPEGQYPALKGKALGVLVGDVDALRKQGGGSGPDDALVFSTGGGCYRWVYVPVQGGRGISNLDIRVGETGDKKNVYNGVDLPTPNAVKQWDVRGSYSLVEIEVNDNLGVPKCKENEGFVATKMRQLDGTQEFPFKVEDVIADLRNRYKKYLAGQEGVIAGAMAKAGKDAIRDAKFTGPHHQEKTEEAMYVTWLPDREFLVVRFRTTIADSAYVNQSESIDFGVEFGQGYEVSKSGKTQVFTLPIQSFAKPPVQTFTRRGLLWRRVAEQRPGADVAEGKDIEAVKKFLVDKCPDERWGYGPTRQRNDAIDTAYPGLRFYYVFSGGREGAEAKMVRVGKDGVASELGNRVGHVGIPNDIWRLPSDPQPFNAGLMKVSKADDAKTAGAAIMSLLVGPEGVCPVERGDVSVTPSGDGKARKGFACKAVRGDYNTFEVRFDADGKCSFASYDCEKTWPICQSTKLLDEDPIMRRLAEQDLLAMGPGAEAYLDSMRPKVSADLQRAIDDIWRRIKNGERPSGPRYYGQARLLTHADPLVRRIVEQNLCLLGSEIIADLKKERDAASGDLKRAIDDLLVKIVERKEE